MRHIEFTIDESYNGKKVNAYLRGCAKLSARLVNSLKRVENGITLNGEHIRTIDILHTGDVLAVNIPEDSSKIEPIEYPLNIVYEDDDILLINKPAGLAMHPTHNHQGDTLANAVAAYFLNKGKNVTFRAVGRLDKSTSGLVLVALNKMAASKLSGEFHKTYYAVVSGEYQGCGTINKPIYRPDPMKTLRAVGETGDFAVTHWEALVTDGTCSFMKIRLETGRTHQIRVHFASMGTPLCGDDMYGSSDKRIARAALHCGDIDFIHPVNGCSMHFSVPVPEDIQAIIPKKS
ncbi:MAG: RluA family pseudouridine synthase [Clostridia bacterium]|nr:RluA family pseudouridine synthase [Clostridia bacterium]